MLVFEKRCFAVAPNLALAPNFEKLALLSLAAKISNSQYADTLAKTESIKDNTESIKDKRTKK